MSANRFMKGTSGDVGFDASYRDALRLFHGESAALRDAGPTLETTVAPSEPPRVVSSDVIEGTTVRAHRVFEAPTVGFAAFLDGTQTSRIVHYDDGAPIVFGRAAAVIRQRVSRRMVTWRRPHTSARLYVPRAFLRRELWARLTSGTFAVVDTTAVSEHDDRGGFSTGSSPSDAHPHALAQRALEAVKRDRERTERELAESWCVSQTEPLFVDGSIATTERVASASCVVGVIKSHRTLYVAGPAMRVVQSLPVGHRSSVLRVEAYHRIAVASWYLRVRDATGHDPMWGLLRVEVALPDPGASPASVTARADLVSRWILAESIPLALPDGRWDKMVYGIKDCEEFLKAVDR